MKLDLPDLLIQDRAPGELRSWLEPWRWRLAGRVVPLFLNRLGCWFLARPTGDIHMLDVFFGQVEPVAGSVEELQRALNDPAWREVYLFSEFVSRLHRVGKVAAGISCYALAPHPAAGGPDPWGELPLDTAAVMLMDSPTWQGLCSEFVQLATRVDPSAP